MSGRTDQEVRASWLAAALRWGRPGAPPLAYAALDLRDRPDHPDHRFDLTVEAGTAVVAIGDEDSGVGDLGSYALALRHPLAGRVEVFGAPVGTLPYTDLLLFRRRIGYHPVGDGLLQNLTLRDNVALPLRFASDHRQAVVDDRVAALMEDFRLRAVAAHRPAAANEEDRRRAALARAVALDPDLVVLEAPFDGLTGRAAQDLLDKVQRREDGSRRAVFVTAQDLVPSVRRMMDRVIKVVDGAAVEEQP
jgi:ABC-type transporter Mla maintaining outer membrane lipid asymmetry ATPase subunit MlaF